MRSKYLALLLVSGVAALLALGGCQGASKRERYWRAKRFGRAWPGS